MTSSALEIAKSHTYKFYWWLQYDQESSFPCSNRYEFLLESNKNLMLDIDISIVNGQCTLRSDIILLHAKLKEGKCLITFSFINLNKELIGQLSSTKALLFNLCKMNMWMHKMILPEWFYENVHSLLHPNGNIQVLTEVTIILDVNNLHSLMPTENDLNCLEGSKDMEDFEALLQNKELCDVTLISSDGLEFQAHKAIIAARSPVFLSTFVHNMKEKCENKVEMKDVDSSVIKAALKFIYTGKFEGLSDMASELLYFADKYDIKKLKMKCEDELSKILCVDKCIPILILADRHNSDNLKSKAIVFMKNNISAVVKTDGYNNMESYPHLLKEIVLELAKK